MSRARQGRSGRVLMGSLAILSFAELAWTEPVWADTAARRKSVYLDVEGACPDGETVAHELLPLLDQWEFSASAELSQEVVRVIDHGTTMEIAALGDVRSVSDPTNDCQERARVAAVFIALRLEPALVPEDEPPTVSPESGGGETTQRPPRDPLKFEIALGGFVERSLDGPVGWMGGALLGFGLSKGGVLGYFSAGITSRSAIEAEGVELWFERIPLDLGMGYSLSRGSWTFMPLLSVAADYFRVRAHNLEDARTQGRLEVGPRFSLRVTRKFGPIRLFATARGAWFPRDYAVDVKPLGEVMRTPRIWIGASAGLVFDIPRR